MDGSRTIALNPGALQPRPMRPSAAGASCIAPAPPVLNRRILINLDADRSHAG